MQQIWYVYKKKCLLPTIKYTKYKIIFLRLLFLKHPYSAAKAWPSNFECFQRAF